MNKREIKFRVWDKIMEDIAPLVELHSDWVAIPIMDEEGGHLEKRKIEDVELMQFTGLKDKNGKEIYEGDIVLGRFILDDVEDYIYLSLTDMERKNQSKTFLIEDISYLYTNPIPEDIEVIGNVFENPELLNKII